MASIRPLAERDIPEVARLHRAVFQPNGGDELAAYHAYFARVFLENPSRDDRLSSLVYRDDEGRLLGFLGVVARRMVLNGARIQAAISTQFVVDPDRHAGLVAVRLAKAFLDGPQDLSITDEATDVARTIWERLGGTTVPLYSLYWTRPLRPARLALSLLAARGSWPRLVIAARPLAAIIDALAARVLGTRLRPAIPRTTADHLHDETFLTRLHEFAGSGSLRVQYDDLTYRWLLERAEQRTGPGRLQKIVVTHRGSVRGWCLWYLDATGKAEILHIAATPSSIPEVLDQVMYQACRQGALAIGGRVEPRFLQALSDKHCLFHRRGPWVLVHSRHPDLVQPFQSGTAFFSRFDGEWCLGAYPQDDTGAMELRPIDARRTLMTCPTWSTR